MNCDINKIINKVQTHIESLISIGLNDRTSGYKVIILEKHSESNINLNIFKEKTDINKKNIIITTNPEVRDNIKKLLEILFSHILKELTEEYALEIFLGTKNELLLEFYLPNSVKYYLVKSNKYLLVISGQPVMILCTIKLSNIDVKKIEIIGTISHYSNIVDNDIKLLVKQNLSNHKLENILLIDRYDLKTMVTEMISKYYDNKILI